MVRVTSTTPSVGNTRLTLPLDRERQPAIKALFVKDGGCATSMRQQTRLDVQVPTPTASCRNRSIRIRSAAGVLRISAVPRGTFFAAQEDYLGCSCLRHLG